MASPAGGTAPLLGVLAPTRAELNAFIGDAAAGLSVPEIRGARRYRFDDAETVALVTGQGASRSAAALEHALQTGLFGAFLIVGVAGATRTGQAPGDLLIASGAGPLYAPPVSATPRLVAALASGLEAAGTSARVGPLAAVERLARLDEKRRLGESGFVGVDMETHTLLGGARQAGIPAAVLRVVLDSLERDIPRSVAALAAAQGGRLWPDILGLVRWPVELRAIMQFTRDTRAALGALRTTATSAVQAIDDAL